MSDRFIDSLQVYPCVVLSRFNYTFSVCRSRAVIFECDTPWRVFHCFL